ncbi:carbonic anhydrase [Gonapodya prolifera JEL478]|uniref:carbonic anhydrase n=1 Tax=Gonapodya prolifera (strain JEL478) TaxID=1344416 RepID=A0A139AVQ5_GONPJ|nr:carbonic anhydrase [Gonapodya prolifera JEL478]|eukprot:KXS20663.1 carbonic anhydrase [Gonapodya prolifera JEL478]
MRTTPHSAASIFAIFLILGISSAIPTPRDSADCVAEAISGRRVFRRQDWSYEGATGPRFWGTLGEEFEACRKGRRQSPINLSSESARLNSSAPIVFKYPRKFGAKVANLGHTVEVIAPEDSALIVRDGVEYSLVQMHLHSPSEHHVTSHARSAEVHLVHRSASGDVQVLAMFLDEDLDSPHVAPAWFRQWKDLAPVKVGLDNAAPAPALPVGALAKTFATLGPFWTYEGSLTTPPCTEGVGWIVANTSVRVSARLLRELTSLMPFNARYTQPTHGEGEEASLVVQ